MAPTNSFEHNSNAVCVMNASGQLGNKLVDRLLRRGYNVHAAVQSQGEVQLEGLPCENTKLKIFQADPFDFTSIIDALKGCSGLFYSFQPPQDQPTYDEYMAEEEVRAAHNVLEACAQTETVDKIVFTSSVTSVIWREDRTSMDADLNERHWSDINFCRKLKLWYALSKTLAEKAAWALVMDRGMNMVSVNAGLLIGPQLSIKDPYLKGAAEMYEGGVFVTVDLDFLVDAHICVFEDISSYGRYLCFNHVVNCPEDGAKLAQMLTPGTHSVPQSVYQDIKIIQQRISNKKLNKLMVEFASKPSVD